MTIFTTTASVLLTMASAQALSPLRIASIEHKPFLEIVDGRYQGFIPDLLDAIAQVEPFSYMIKIPADGRYGGNLKNGKWTGMIGMVVDKEADMVAADLTSTVDRMSVLDFSMPFLQTSVTILMKSPGMSWNLHRSAHGLTATPAMAVNPITVEQLLNMTDTRFGVVFGGSTDSMLRRTQLPSHQAIFSSIQNNQHHEAITTNAQGVEKVKSETGFGFLIEKLSAEYHVGKDESCSLYTVGNLAAANYAFGFLKGSEMSSNLREQFSRGILKVTSNGDMYSLVNKWFPENQNCFSSRISAASGSP